MLMRSDRRQGPLALLEEATHRMRHGDAAGALPLAAEACEDLRAAGDLREAARCLDCLAQCHLHSGAIDQALTVVVQAIAAWEEAGDPVGVAKAHSEYARLLHELSRSQHAIEEGSYALRAAEATADKTAIAHALLNLGIVYWGMEQWDEAAGLLSRAIGLVREASDDYLLARALTNEANVHMGRANQRYKAKEIDRAEVSRLLEPVLVQQSESLAIARRIGASWLEYVILINTVGALLVINDLDRAEQIVVGDLGARRGGVREECGRYVQLGGIYLARGEHDRAAQAYAQGLATAEREDYVRVSMLCHEKMAQAYEQAGKLREALEAHRRFHACYVRMASEAAQMRARAEAVLLQTESARAEAKAERNRAENLERTAEELSRVSLEDALTGIANRRSFDAAVKRLAGAAESAYSVALLDIDHFKQVNDGYSHMVGDEVLRRIGRILRDACRQGDMPARYGGEEFGLLLLQADRNEALAACERIRAAIESHPWSEVAPALRVTASLGIASTGETSCPQRMLALADERLYAAKAAGRNCVAAG
jgi:two-component system cell cycle response regulator